MRCLDKRELPMKETENEMVETLEYRTTASENTTLGEVDNLETVPMDLQLDPTANLSPCDMEISSPD